jgi:hypothetical protein
MPGQNPPAEINLRPRSRNFRFLEERFIFLAIVSKPAISQAGQLQLVDFDDGLSNKDKNIASFCAQRVETAGSFRRRKIKWNVKEQRR